MTTLREQALADLPGLRTRYASIFSPPPARRLWTLGVLLALALLLALSVWRLDISPGQVLAGFGKLGQFVVLMIPPDPGSLAKAVIFLKALAETVAIAFLGTLLAAIIAFPVGFIAARNTTINRLVQFAARRVLDGVRGIDALIWALIWINVVGLGPFAGVLAIMTSDIGAFGKLFSEAIEAADKKPVEGVLSTGGAGLHRVRFGILPQVLPVILGQVLYYFESNTRSSAIIGIVGAGGIGLHLYEQIRTLEWQAVSFIIILVLIAVATIDAVSGRIRREIIGTSQVRPV